jgi:hypothetical protein
MLTDTIYRLDLPTLLQFLRDQSSVVLSTTVDVPPDGEACYGYLLLKNRAIIDCQIQSQNGTVLYRGEEAYQLLNTKTQWQVRIDSTHHDETKSPGQHERSRRIAKAISSIPDTYVPRVIRPLEPSLLNAYSLQQRVILRTVFAMINGQRAISQMKGQLHLSSEAVNEALTSLKSIGVIEL